jgi:hypothetical protein
MKHHRSVVLASALLCAGATAQAAPLCAGATSVAALGAVGCTFGSLTFSDFSVTGSDADTTLIEIGASTLGLDILTSVPAIGLTVRPEDPSAWEASGLFGSFSFSLDYVVTALDAELDLFQFSGSGPGSSLRGPLWSGSLTVAEGSPTVSGGSRGPFLEVGTVDPGTSVINVSTQAGVSPGIAGGTGRLDSVRNVFTTVPVESVPAPATALLLLAGLAGAGFRGRSS